MAGKKGFEGVEGSGEASSSCPGSTGEEASCGNIEVHAGPSSCSSTSKSSSCANVHRGTSSAEHA